MSDQQECKAYIGNLPSDAIAKDVEDLLRHLSFDDETIKKCDIHLCHDRDSGRFRGFAYVTLFNEEQLSTVTEKLNGVEYGGQVLKVNRAQSRGNSQRGGRGGHRGVRGGPRQNHDGGRPAHGNDRHGGRGGQRNRFRKSQSQSEDHPTVDKSEGKSKSEHAERPKLNLQPRTTDPAVLAAKKKQEEEETSKRQAKIFG